MSWKWPISSVAGLTLALIAGAGAQQPPELIIRRGLIVTASGRAEADLRIRGDKIAEIGRNLPLAAGGREIDARGMFVVPGAIDPHTHLVPELPNPPRPNANQDDYVSGSAAALAGGVTTVSNFIGLQGTEDISAYADRVIGQIEKSSIADVFVHVSMGGDPVRFTDRATLDKLADQLSNAKYSTYGRLGSDRLAADDDTSRRNRLPGRQGDWAARHRQVHTPGALAEAGAACRVEMIRDCNAFSLVLSLSNHEQNSSSFDKPVLSDELTLRQAQGEQGVEGLRDERS